MEEIGALLVRLLFEDDDFTEGSKAAEAKFSKTTQVFTEGAFAASRAITKAFAAASAAVAGFVTASAVVGAGFERQIDVVGAIANATTTQLTALEEQARSLGASTVFTATQAAEGLQALAQAGATVEESISVSGDALNFAIANQVELEAATQTVISSLRQFNLGVEESGRVTDVLTRATQTSLLNFNDLTTALRFGGPAAAGFGLSLEETTAVLAAFRDIGLEGSLAGTALRQALAQGAQASERQEEVLGQLGLTFEDINAQTVDLTGNAQGFIGVVENLARSTAEVDEIIALFGVRAGPAVASLVNQTREGTIELRQSLATLESSAGTTAVTVERVSDNVATQVQIVLSALEDVFLSTFDAIRGPIQDTLEALIPFLNEVSAAIADVGQRIESSLGDAVTRFADALDRNGRDAAETFASTLVLAADAASALLNVTSALLDVFGLLKTAIEELGLAPFIDELVVLTGLISTLGTVVGGLALALGPLSAALGGASGAAGGFSLVVAGLGGPVTAAAAAVTAITFGFIQYRVAAREAEEATAALDAVIADLAARRDAVLADVTGDQLTGDLRSATEDFVAQQRAAVNAGQDLSDALLNEIDALDELRTATDEEIDLQIASGDLVVVEGRLRTVAGIVEDLDPAGFEAIEESARRFSQEAAAIERNLVAVRDRFEEAQEIASADGGRFAAFEFGTEEATREFIEQQEERRRSLIEAERALIQQRDDAERAFLRRENAREEQRTARAEQEANRRAAAAEQEADARIRAAARAEQQIRQIQGQATTEGGGLFLTDAQQVGVELQKQEQQVRTALAQFLQTFSGTEEQRQQVIADSEDTIQQLRANAQARLQALEEQAQQQRQAAAVQARDVVVGITQTEVSRAEQIRRQGAQAIVQLERSTAEQRAAIEAQFGARAAAAETARERADIARERNATLLELERQLQEQRAQILVSTEQQRNAALRQSVANAQKAARDAVEANERAITQVVQNIVDAPGPIARAWNSALQSVQEAAFTTFPQVSGALLDVGKAAKSTIGAVGDIGSNVLGLLGSLTGGFGVDIGSIVDTVIGDTAAAEERVTEAAATFEQLREAQRRGEATQDEVDAARQELLAAQAAAGETGGGGADLVQQAADTAVAFVTTLADELPGILETLTTAIGDVITSVVENAGDIIQALLDAIPGLISAVSEAVQALVAVIPSLVTQILTQLPDIITAILAEIPILIGAIVTAVPQVVDAVISALPDILTAIIEGVPDILIALVDAIPVLVLTVIDAIPRIIGVVIGAIPTLITEIIGAVPNIILSVVRAVPDIITALVTLAPTLVAEIISQLPAIIVALIDVLIFELIPALPEIAFELVKAFPEALLGIFQDLVGVFQDVFLEALGPIGDLFEGNGDGLFSGGGALDDLEAGLFGTRSAQQGVPFVARTASTVVHEGEAILSAAENRRRLFQAPQTTRQPAQAGAGQPVRGGSQRLELRVQIGDQDFDRFLVEADDRGNMGLSNRRTLQKTNTHVGFRKLPK